MDKQPSRVSSITNKKNEKKKKRRKAIVLSFTIVTVTIILIIIAFIWSVFREVNKTLPAISIAPQVTTDVHTKEEVPVVIPIEETVKEKALTMALVGIDSRTGGGGLNTDVIILVTLNPDTKKGYVISMPRDSKMTYTYNDKEYTQKVNSIYADGYQAARKNGADQDGQKLAGMDRLKTAISQFYDVDVKYATTVNFKGFKDVVDTLGGIDVYVDMNMNYTDSHDNTNINLKKGDQTLNGQQALDFVRFRQTNDNPNASSDFERNERQSRVIQAMLKKLVSFGGITKVNSIIREVADDVTSDMPVSEIEDIISTYITINPNNLTFTSLPGYWKSPYVYPDEEALNNAKQEIQKIIAE